MTTKERFKRMYEHREADRVPITDSPWRGTIARWKREGMPENADWREFFGADKLEGISVDMSPRYPEKILEDTERYTISTTKWGVTLKNFKTEDSSPEFIDFKVNNSDEWQKAKEMMRFDPSRLDLKALKAKSDLCLADNRWLRADFWFGFDVTHSWMVGTETLLIAMIEEPEWVKDIFSTYLESCIEYFDYLWANGVRFDEIGWPDDMGYKGTTFFSLETYRSLLKPYHAKAAAWAHEHGIYAHLHSCGYIEPFIPDLLEAGIDALNPLEVKAGMKPAELKKKFGDKLVLHGGINAVLWDKKDIIVEEIRKTVPILKENGGYIFSSDHSIPNTVSLENFKEIVAVAKEAGKF